MFLIVKMREYSKLSSVDPLVKPTNKQRQQNEAEVGICANILERERWKIAV